MRKREGGQAALDRERERKVELVRERGQAALERHAALTPSVGTPPSLINTTTTTTADVVCVGAVKERGSSVAVER